MRLQIRMLDEQMPVPSYAKPGDAGADLSSTETLTLAPGQRALVGTGVALAIPEGYVGLIHPRSGLAHKAGLSMVNAPGTVDAGYRGEIKVNLINMDPTTPILIQRGDRIAQLLIQKVERAVFEAVEELPPSLRSDSGFGSSGGSAHLL